jgi:hypothetical protein
MGVCVGLDACRGVPDHLAAASQLKWHAKGMPAFTSLHAALVWPWMGSRIIIISALKQSNCAHSDINTYAPRFLLAFD